MRKLSLTEWASVGEPLTGRPETVILLVRHRRSHE